MDQSRTVGVPEEHIWQLRVWAWLGNRRDDIEYVMGTEEEYITAYFRLAARAPEGCTRSIKVCVWRVPGDDGVIEALFVMETV